MTTLARRMRLKYMGDRNRGHIYTGRPGAPHWATIGKRRTNSHDHSATASKRGRWYAVICPHCRHEQSVDYGRSNKCSKCRARI